MKRVHDLVGIIGAAVLCVLAGMAIGMKFGGKNTSAENATEPVVVVSDADVALKIKAQFPDIGDIGVSDSQIFGLKEVTVKKTSEVFYTDTGGRYIVIGLIADKDGRNYTKERMDMLKKTAFEGMSGVIDKSAALVIGTGANEVIEFTDVDCPYCRQVEGFFEAPDADATRYIFFTPIDSLHPDAAKKSVHILCSADKAAEYKKIVKGGVTDYIECDEGKLLLGKHRAIADKLGIQGTPQFFINGTQYTGADPEIQNIIRKK